MWSSGGVILRDLSRVQGGAGGGELCALRPRELPPAPLHHGTGEHMERVLCAARGHASLLAETDEYVRHLAPAPAPAGPCAAPPLPDLTHIQQMLNMVRTLSITAKEDADDEEAVEWCGIERGRSARSCGAERGARARSPPAAAEPCPASRGRAPTEHRKLKRRRRNIALESILQALEKNDAISCTSEQYTLPEMEGLIANNPENINKSPGGGHHTNSEDTENTNSYDNIDSNEKVNSWMNQMMKPIKTKSQSKQIMRDAIRLDPSSMFKKRVKVDIAEPCTELNPAARDKDPSRHAASLGNGAAYVPSGAASLCYQRYLERNKLLQMREEEASQRAAALVAQSIERAVRAEDSQLAASGEGGGACAAAACVEPRVSLALRSAPASVRLAAPRPCVARARCLVCARLTRRAAPTPPPHAGDVTWR